MKSNNLGPVFNFSVNLRIFMLLRMGYTHDPSASKQVIQDTILRGSEFSSYKIELRNRVTQNDATLRVIKSNIFIEVYLSSY